MENNAIKFKMIGVDVAKLKLDIAFDDKHIITIDNQKDSFKQLLKLIANTTQALKILETERHRSEDL